MTHADVLRAKRENLQFLQSTIRPDANIQSASARPFQVESDGKVQQGVDNQGNPIFTFNPVGYPAQGAPPVEILRYQVAPSLSGQITGLTIRHNGAAGSFIDFSGNVLWHVLRNGFPVRGLENIWSQVGSVEQPQGVLFLLQQNDIYQVLVECPLAPPAGYPWARFSGYTTLGGLGTYVDETRREQLGAGTARSANASNNGRAPYRFGGPRPY